MNTQESILEINLKNLSNNIQQLKSLNFNKNKTIIAIIKSDAYGHGLLEIAQVLEKKGINFFGIIKLDDAFLLKNKLNNPKILMLSGVDEKHIAEAIGIGISICVFDLNYLKTVYEAARKIHKKALIHLKYDSGMNRLGFKDDELLKALDYIEEIKKNGNFLEFEGIFSHFSSAETDIDYTRFQLNNYKNILKIISDRKLKPLYAHISASSSMLGNEIKDDFSNSVRPGISLYGINPVSPQIKLNGNGIVEYSNKKSCIGDNSGNHLHNILANDNDKKFQLNESNNSENHLQCHRIYDLENLDLKPLMTLKTGIIQIKQIKKGCSVSYGRTFRAPSDMTIGIINAGYDNGIPRMLSNKGRVIINDQYADIIGTITMNMIIIDLSKIQNTSLENEAIIMGESGDKRITVEEIANYAKTIPYEICLNIGKSNKRIYHKLP
ncbi:MAG: alanine racemase [bacterium]